MSCPALTSATSPPRFAFHIKPSLSPSSERGRGVAPLALTSPSLRATGLSTSRLIIAGLLVRAMGKLRYRNSLRQCDVALVIYIRRTSVSSRGLSKAHGVHVCFVHNFVD